MLKLYVSLSLNVFWNCALKRTSLRNIQLALPWFYVISWHLCLKWWDRWVPQSIYWGIFVWPAPLSLPPFVYLACAGSIDPAIRDIYPKASLKKDPFHAAVVRWVIRCQLVLFRFGIIWSVCFLNDVACVFPSRYLNLMILLVRVSRFHRSLY